MRFVSRNSWPIWGGVLLVLGGLVVWEKHVRTSFADPNFATGYLLFAFLVFLALYNGRKRLAMIPAGRASVWLTAHLAVGALAVALFWLHSSTLWPLGTADQVLAGLFYIVCASGVVGYGLQLWLPGRLARAGREIIYERIPAEVARIRAEVEQTVVAAADESGHDTLGRYYLQALAWYFARPRFVWSHAFGGGRAEHWFRRHLDTIGRYLSAAERRHLARIAELGAEKRHADVQYAMQSLLKRWTFLHVPLAGALLVIASWHLILVHVFAR